MPSAAKMASINVPVRVYHHENKSLKLNWKDCCIPARIFYKYILILCRLHTVHADLHENKSLKLSLKDCCIPARIFYKDTWIA
jgi:hypothetical protein